MTRTLLVIGGVLIGLWSAWFQAGITLRDDAGILVELAAPAKRIVSLAPSNTESLFAIGAGDRIVAVTRFDTYPPEAAEIPRIGGFADVDLERVLAHEPDLVLAAGFQAGGVVPRLRGFGLTVFVVEPGDAMGVFDRLEALGELVGERRAAVRVADELRARMALIEARVAEFDEHPRVFYELSRDHFTVGSGSFVHDLIERAGGDNIASDADRPYPQLSDEIIIDRDPEIIFLAEQDSPVSFEELRSRAGWANISAVASGRVFVLDDPDLVSRPGPRIVDALELIAAAIHPGAFDARRTPSR